MVVDDEAKSLFLPSTRRLSSSCNVELAFLVTLLVGDVAEGDGDEDDDNHSHADAHVDDLVVDAAVGFSW